MTDMTTEQALPWSRLTKMIHEYIDDYHLEGDEGSYTPTRREHLIAEDIINSMLVDDEMADAIRAALSRPADTEASRTLDALIALAAGDDGLPDDMRADVERLRGRLSRPAVPELLDADKVHAEKEALDVQFKTPYMHTLRWVQGWNSCREAMLAAAPEPASAGAVGCYDCGLQYGGPSWIEAVIPDKAWNLIRPEGAAEGCGILCISCIAKRLREHGIEHCPVWLCGTEPLRPFGQKDCAEDLPVLRQWEPGQPSAEGDSE